MSGPFGSSQWMYNAGGAFYDFPITNSLRFNDDDSAYLRRTCSTAGNRKTWTTSLWVKRANLGSGQKLGINSGTSNTKFSGFFFTGDDVVEFFHRNNTSDSYAVRTERVFRDTSSWYHFVLVCDTTQSTAADRVKMFVNGEQVLFPTTVAGTSGFPSQNQDMEVNNTAYHQTIGANWNGVDRFDGYHADITHIDGLALTPSSFAETKNDIWIPKDTSGLTFGTNGFRQQYKQTGTGTASSTTIGADTSGNDNHYTSTNLVASDVMPDSPTNNFATMNPLATNDTTLSEGNLKVSRATTSYAAAKGSFGMSEGSWYWEVNPLAQQISLLGITNNLALSGIGAGNWGYHHDGTKYVEATNSSYGTAPSAGDVVGFAFNADTGTLTGYLNNSSQGTIVTGLSGTFFPSVVYYGTSSSVLNFGQDSSFAGNETAQGNADENGIGDFYYAPPSGFLALCTANLPDPVATIDPAKGGSPQDYFNTVLYTGAGSGADANTVNTVGFQPDFTWIKNRGDNENHVLQDSVRGVAKFLQSNTTGQDQDTGGGDIKEFNSAGFILGYTNNRSNATNDTYVAWNWKAGTAFSNDASATGVGSIDSTGSVNTDVGFSIISYAGNTTADAQIAHGLGVAPEVVIFKRRDGAADWHTYHAARADAAGTLMYLNTTSAGGDTAAFLNDVAPSSTVINLGDSAGTNGSSMIAYCFASVDGYSKFGGYSGNNSTDGPFVYTGFRPELIIVKRTNATYGWMMYDNTREPFNVMHNVIQSNLSNAEAGSDNLDFVSNGFKLRTTGNSFNGSGGTYIYMAFAEQPFKYANAR